MSRLGSGKGQPEDSSPAIDFNANSGLVKGKRSSGTRADYPQLRNVRGFLSCDAFALGIGSEFLANRKKISVVVRAACSAASRACAAPTDTVLGHRPHMVRQQRRIISPTGLRTTRPNFPSGYPNAPATAPTTKQTSATIRNSLPNMLKVAIRFIERLLARPRPGFWTAKLKGRSRSILSAKP
jgi:hypothetical protein